MGETPSDIVNAFRDANFEVPEAIADSLVQLTVKYSISSSDLVQRYDVCAMDREWDSNVTSSRVQKLCDALVSNPPQQQHVTPIKSTAPLGIALQRDEGLIDFPSTTKAVTSDNGLVDDFPHTPLPNKHSAPIKFESSSVKKPRLDSAFKNRSKVGDAQVTLNQHLKLEAPATPQPGEAAISVRCPQVLLPETHLECGQRYGHDSLDARANYLEGRITRSETAFTAAGFGICQPVGRPSQDSALHVGRICSEAEDGRLSDSKLILEGSSATSDGVRVFLDLSRVTSYRVFPGQVVAVLATNPSGKQLLATKLYTAMPFVQASSPALHFQPGSRADEMVESGATGNETCCIAVAAGPFTTSADCNCEPLHELLHTLRTQKLTPTVVILVGPFLDDAHPQLSAGLLENTFQQLFEAQVLKPICDWATEFTSSRVILVPSCRDLMADPVFPTPPLNTPTFVPDNVTMLSNPTTFKICQVTFGIVSSDTMKALAATELTRSATQGDRMISLASHVVSQRSFFPVYPPPRGALLDTSLAAEHLRLPLIPNILILPSDLAPFAKMLPVSDQVKSATSPEMTVPTAHSTTVVVVNPGRVAKGVAGGTWAFLAIAGSTSPTEGTNLTDVHSRCRVDISRV